MAALATHRRCISTCCCCTPYLVPGIVRTDASRGVCTLSALSRKSASKSAGGSVFPCVLYSSSDAGALYVWYLAWCLTYSVVVVDLAVCCCRVPGTIYSALGTSPSQFRVVRCGASVNWGIKALLTAARRCHAKWASVQPLHSNKRQG